MDIVKSIYTSAEQTWEERINAMRMDLRGHEYAYLFFKVALSMNDAKDNADYDRYSILKRLAYEVHIKDDIKIATSLTELEGVE